MMPRGYDGPLQSGSETDRTGERAPHVAVGEVVTCRVDLAMFHDSSGPRRLKPMLETLGAGIWDKSEVVLVIDRRARGGRGITWGGGGWGDPLDRLPALFALEVEQGLVTRAGARRYGVVIESLRERWLAETGLPALSGALSDPRE
jgi:hypothetical protein